MPPDTTALSGACPAVGPSPGKPTTSLLKRSRLNHRWRRRSNRVRGQ